MYQMTLKELWKFSAQLRVLVHFNVTLAPHCETDEDLYLVGNLKQLGNWNHPGLPLRKTGPLTYCAYDAFPVDVPLFYKVTRGKWGKEEVLASGRARPNRLFIPHIASSNIVEIDVEQWADRVAATSIHSITGTIEKIPQIESEFLKYSRDVMVYLPREYSESGTRHYPVCFFNDGQNIFDGATAFAGIEWGVDETLDELEEKGVIEPIIAVAVYNTPARSWEYTPTNFIGGGGLDAYGKFIMNELTPQLMKRYRINLRSEETGMVGSSLGGLASFHLGWKYPHFFQKLGVVSPSLWWDDLYSLKLVSRGRKKKNVKIWLDMGELESIPTLFDEEMSPVYQTKRLRDLLVRRGWKMGIDLQCVIDKEGRHDEESWARRTPKMLSFLYGNNSV